MITVSVSPGLATYANAVTPAMQAKADTRFKKTPVPIAFPSRSGFCTISWTIMFPNPSLISGTTNETTAIAYEISPNDDLPRNLAVSMLRTKPRMDCTNLQPMIHDAFLATLLVIYLCL